MIGEEAALLLVELRLSMLNVWVKQLAKTNEMISASFVKKFQSFVSIED